MGRAIRTLLITTGLLAAALLGGGAALAQEAGQPDAESPDDVTLIAPFRSIAPDGPTDDAEFNLTFINHSTERRIVRFDFSDVPEGWEANVWDRFTNFRLRQLAIEPYDGTEESNEAEHRLRITPDPEDTEGGSFPITLNIVSVDGRVTFDTAVITVVLPRLTPVESGDVVLESTFPFLQGAATSRFSFEVAIKNRTGADASLDLSAESPLNWTVQFLPAFGDERIISSVAPVDNATQRVSVRVQPPPFERAGVYTIPFTVSNDSYSSTIPLSVEITGRPDLNLATVSGRLNVDAPAGEETIVEMVVGNLGSGDLSAVSFFGSAPDGWTVQFDKNETQGVAAGDVEQLYAFITPPSDAIPGDYAVTITARSPEDFSEVEFRVSVTQSTIWGWLGIVIVIVVLGGLIGLFVRLGRR